MFNKRKVLIIGAGYVGSASAISMAKNGNDVFLYDKNIELIVNWTNGILPFKDVDLCEALADLRKKNVAPKALSQLTDTPSVDAILICVATPVVAGQGYDLEHLKNALTEVVMHLSQKNHSEALILIRSTLPPTSMQNIILPLVKSNWHHRTQAPTVVYFPEFFREGSALADLKDAPLYILGGDETFSNAELVESIFNVASGKLTVVRTGEAEMIKICSNTFHALKVSFSNEIANICASIEIDPHVVMQNFCEDKKLNISSMYLRPGFSFGGPCLEKDLGGLIETASANLPVLKSIKVSNDLHFESLVQKFKNSHGSYKKVGIIGLSFKGGSVDARNSPVCTFIDKLKEDFSFFTVNESHSVVTSKPDFEELASEVELVVLASGTLAENEVKLIIKKNIPVVDLGLNFKNLELAKKIKNFKSLVCQK